MNKETVSGYNLLLMGLACGTALGILIAPLLGLGAPRWERLDDEKDESDEPGMAKKLIDKIPTRVKLAAVGGAVKGGGKEAYHELKKKATGER